MPASELTMPAITLVAGQAHGQTLKLTDPLNAWAGLDPDTGFIVHHSHSQGCESLAGRVLAMQVSRGSVTNGQVFAQAWSTGNGPVAVVLAVPDYVLCGGAVVSHELYGVVCPVVVVGADHYNALGDGETVAVGASDTRA